MSIVSIDCFGLKKKRSHYKKAALTSLVNEFGVESCRNVPVPGEWGKQKGENLLGYNSSAEEGLMDQRGLLLDERVSLDQRCLQTVPHRKSWLSSRLSSTRSIANDIEMTDLTSKKIHKSKSEPSSVERWSYQDPKPPLLSNATFGRFQSRTLLISSFLPLTKSFYDPQIDIVIMVNSPESVHPKLLNSHPYYVAREVRATERTYIHDLEILCLHFRATLENKDHLFFDILEHLLEIHRIFLANLENRISKWTEGTTMSDIMTSHVDSLTAYSSYLDNLLGFLSVIPNLGSDFESNKICYLPLSYLLLRPVQRILHYHLLLEKLSNHSSAVDENVEPLNDAALDVLGPLYQRCGAILFDAFQACKVGDLSKDLVNGDLLAHSERKLIREGSLVKVSASRGHQRMFFLFHDILIYTSRGVTATNQFRIHGQIDLRQVTVSEITDGNVGFVIQSDEPALTVTASSEEEKLKWIRDIESTRDKLLADKDAVTICTTDAVIKKENYEKSEDSGEVDHDDEEVSKQPLHRSNTTLHVCWHRCLSVSFNDHLTSMKNQMSGYLHRKFKNSNGWQRLWVVFSNFCLFFYKTHQNQEPLASLPLLGYNIIIPSDSDGIHHPLAFKLHYKTHVYFFRSDCELSFGRWLDVISSSTNTR